MATNNSINNTSNPLATTAATIDPAAAADSYVQFNVNGSGKFRVGDDQSASDAFKISAGSGLGTNDTLIMTTSGQQRLPLQPSFVAKPSAGLVDETGDGTAYTVVYASEDFDQGSNFSTSTFTAPVAGKYYLYQTTRWVGVALTSTSYSMKFNKNAGSATYENNLFNPVLIGVIGGGEAAFSTNAGIVISLAASDTVSVTATIGGVSKTSDINGTSQSTFFGGYLIC